MPATTSNAISKAGITTDANGERHIPSSKRADGSLRKEIRVRPGYRPPEDVEVYKNRSAESWKNRGKGGVPGAEPVEAATSLPSAASKRNAKRKEAREKAAELGTDSLTAVPSSKQDEPKPEPVDPEAEKEKEARKILKKLRQARELKQKKADGDALLPEQFAKVIKINELLRQLENLGFDGEGDKKADKPSDPSPP